MFPGACLPLVLGTARHGFPVPGSRLTATGYATHLLAFLADLTVCAAVGTALLLGDDFPLAGRVVGAVDDVLIVHFSAHTC